MRSIIICPLILPLAALILLARTSAGLLLSLNACPCGFLITTPFGAIVKLNYLVRFTRFPDEKAKLKLKMQFMRNEFNACRLLVETFT